MLPIGTVRTQAFTNPTDAPEADGTASWNSTTVIVVQVKAGDREGVGYTYADPGVAMLVTSKPASVVAGLDVVDPPCAWRAMQVAVRDLGRDGLTACATSAVDGALWDLKAKLLDLSLAHLLGQYRDQVLIYGSGGFASYDGKRPAEQLSVVEVAAGEYGDEPTCFRRMLEAGAVDVLQADATRCGGVSGSMLDAAQAEAFHVELSADCAPALHRHLGLAAPRFRHCERFHDHVRIERMLFDGAPVPQDGAIGPDPGQPGLGLLFKQQDAERFAAGAGG